MPVLTIRYGLLLNFDEIFECTGKNTVEVMAEFFAKLLIVQREYYDCNNSVFICGSSPKELSGSLGFKGSRLHLLSRHLVKPRPLESLNPRTLSIN